MKALALAAMLAAGPAAADPVLPMLYDVAGVGSGDALNLREAPDPRAPIVGTLAPDARAIEVVALDPTGRWGRVNAGEQSAWVALRYLQAEPDVWASGTLPAGLACLGTEPFWSLRPKAGTLVYSTPDAGEQILTLVAALDTGVPGDPRRALVGRGASTGVTALITPGACSDGMSDRAFGLLVSVILGAPAAPSLLTGCCSIAP